MHVLSPRLYRRCVPLVGMVGGWWTLSSIIVLLPFASCFLAWIRIITELTETGRKARNCGRGRGPHFTLEEFLCWTHWLMPAETRRRLSLIQMLRDMCPDYYMFSLPPWISFSFFYATIFSLFIFHIFLFKILSWLFSPWMNFLFPHYPYILSYSLQTLKSLLPLLYQPPLSFYLLFTSLSKGWVW